MKIHKEGYHTILITLIFILIINFIAHFFFKDFETLQIAVYLFSGFLFIAILQFFRVPKRLVNPDESYILSPADGKVVVIEEVEETEYFHDKRMQVSIFMSPVNVHINWLPVSGEIKYMKYHPGAYKVAWHPKSSTENERTTLVIDSISEIPVLMRQIAGALAKRIVYYVKEGDFVTQGDQMGFIKFGSRVDLLLPLDVNLKVELGQKVKGNKTIIAEIPDEDI